jgi:hypothetical protein
MKQKRKEKVFIKVVFYFGIALILTVGFLTVGLANAYEDTYHHKNVCPGGSVYLPGDYYNTGLECYVEKSGFAQCHCTAYVAWKINEIFLAMGVSTEFSNDEYLISRWGNGGEWDNHAPASILVNHTPVPGAAAYWNKGTWGHIAFVEAVRYDESGDVTSIDITEYNFPHTGRWNHRNIEVGHNQGELKGYPDGFVHIVENELAGRSRPFLQEDCGPFPESLKNIFGDYDDWDSYCKLFNPNSEVESYRKSDGSIVYDRSSKEYPYYCVNCEVKYFDYILTLDEFYSKKEVPLPYFRYGDIAWYPPDKSCFNAERWILNETTYGDNSVCLTEAKRYLNFSNFYLATGKAPPLVACIGDYYVWEMFFSPDSISDSVCK